MLQYIEKYDISLKPNEKIEYPDWWGRPEFHDSHKAMLFHKGVVCYCCVVPPAPPPPAFSSSLSAQLAVKLAKLNGKEIENPYAQFKDYAHITVPVQWFIPAVAYYFYSI
jgi:hypothetical protein